MRLAIDRLGTRGDGFSGEVAVAGALPGEVVSVTDTPPHRLLAVEQVSPHRVEPHCPAFGRCGGCAIQHLAAPAYQAWKRDLVVTALAQQGLAADVAPLVDAHGSGRRRVTLHARRGLVGFAEARSHAIVPLEACPVLEPGLSRAFVVAGAIEAAFRSRGKPLDIQVTATLGGLDVAMRGLGGLDGRDRLAATALAERLDLARLANHNEVLIERRQPAVRFGGVAVVPPAGSFLQATGKADGVLADLVGTAVGEARRVADLFSGCGTLSLALAARAAITAYDSDGAAIEALARAARGAGLRWPVTAETRDLFRRPLMEAELKGFEAVVFDPPRAGAAEQARRLSASRVSRVVAVSCDAGTFARDARLLVDGGYRIETVTPVDQFRHTPHVEIVAAFSRA